MCLICVQTLYSILLCHHFAVNNIFHKLFIQNETFQIHVIGAVGEGRPVKWIKRLQFMITFLKSLDGNKLVLNDWRLCVCFCFAGRALLCIPSHWHMTDDLAHMLCGMIALGLAPVCRIWATSRLQHSHVSQELTKWTTVPYLYQRWFTFAISHVGHFRFPSILFGPDKGHQCITAWFGPRCSLGGGLIYFMWWTVQCARVDQCQLTLLSISMSYCNFYPTANILSTMRIPPCGPFVSILITSHLHQHMEFTQLSITFQF